MLKKFFCKALVVLAIMITFTTLFSVSALAVEENTVMTVYTKDLDEEIYKEFDNFEDGWVFLIEKYTTYFDVFDVKLYADWVAPDGYFYYTNEDGDEVGTDKGRLAVGISWYDEGGAYDHNQINIDLNGHKIDRNLKNPTKNGSVFLIESGSVRIFDSSEAQTGMITGGNNTGNGGAFLVDNGAFNIEKSAILLDGGTITGNYAANGAGIYWNSDGLLIITDGAITGNHATEKGGGVYFDDWGGIYIGGTPVIKDNYIKGTSKQSNLYLADTDVVLKLTRDQDEAFNIQHIPDIPLSEGAQIGISTIGDDEKLTDENSLFREEDFTYFFPDDTTHFVRSVHSEKEGVTSYDLYYTSWQNENKRAPRVTNVSVKDNSLVKGIDFNNDKQTLTLTVANNKRDCFDMMALDRLVSLEFNDEKYYLARIGNPLNLHEGQQYRIMADNGTYVLLIVNIVPEGGKWADVQDPYVPEYAAIVFNEHYTAGYSDIGKAWADAVKQSITHPTTIKLFSDWIAKDGKFYAEDANGDEYGTDDGYLDIDDETIDLTIDLNGYTIDRNLDKPVSNGYIMYIGEGLVTITDTSEEGNGKITGGNNTGDGGAIFMDNGAFGLPTEGGNLIIKGGNITGNHSDYRGGAIYSEAPFTSITVYDVKITDNTAKYGGAVALTSTSDAHFYGGDISGNSATKYGGAFYCYDGGDVVVDGSTVVSNNTAPYGGCAYIGIQGELRFYSGYIKDNTADYGGGIYTYESFVMGGSEAYLINNIAKYDGGGVCALGEYGEVRINYGNIKGNKAINGAGIYWNAYNDIFGGVLNNVIITGNEASGIGGGVYVADDRYVYVGGKTVIQDNTSSLGTDNLNLIGYDSCITHGAVDYFGTSLSEGSEIGIRAEKIKNERIIVSDEGGFEENSINYFTADDPTTRLTSVADTDYSGYRISLVDNYGGEMLVEVEGGDTKSFEDFGKGWVYALQQSLEKPTTVTLGADWIARDGVFYCVDEDGDEYGTKDGYLHINDNHIITIDLNGHKIDRNLSEPTDDGVVFWLYDDDAKLTIKDSFGGGIITGANNDGNGGAFFVGRGSLYIEGGEIRDNKAENGAGIYWESKNNLCVYGGVIAANEAGEFGGGIYGTDWGNMYFGGDAIVSGNTDKYSENNNLYLDDDDVYVNLTAGQSEDIPNVPFRAGASIGISAYDTQALISGSNSCFGWEDLDYFFSDRDMYFLRKDYEADGGNNAYKLYIDIIANKPVTPPVMSVTVKDGATLDFTDFDEGWSYALKQSLIMPTTIKLLADWYSENGSFDYSKGTDEGYFYLNDNYDITIDLNGHKIDRNLSDPIENGVVFWLYDYDAKLTIKDSVGGGVITGANNVGNGGAFFVERGSLYIEGGEIRENKATNGAGIYWESRNNLYIYGGKITENTASANGGGVYLTDWGNVYVGGSIVVDGNICGTKSENVYLSDANIFLKYAGGQNGSVPFTDGAKIGLTCHEVVHYVQFTNADSGFGADCSQYFVPDDDIYFIDNVYDDVTGAYNLSVAYDQDGCMYVKTQDSEKRFSDLGKGWVYALKMSMETPTTIKLESDWTPCTDKGFCYLDEGGSEYGTDEGRLYLNNSNINLTIDLNGHSISRSLAAPVKNGQVFCMSAGTLTIIDTSESKNGKITGGNSSYYGGGFYAYGGTIYLKSGNITENTAYCGGGFYIDEAELFLEGGSVSNNTADRGGGIYVNDTTLTIEDGEVSRNHAGLNGGGVYGYDKSIVYMKGGTVADNECEADGGGFYFGMAAGSMNMTGGSIVRNKAAYDGGGIFWNCNGILALTGGVITENHADMGYNLIHWNANGGGGVFASHSRYGLTPIGSDPYIGGNIQIYNNTSCISKSILPSWNNANIVESNMFLDENLITVKQALGQEEGVPNAPLTDGAYVGISSSFELVITGENSKFDQASLKYLHSDADNFYIDAVLDNDYYRLSLVKQSGIIAYNKNSKEIVADIKEAGKYIVVFADYENGCFANVDIVEYDFKEGINIVPQEDTSFALGSGDKVMLWSDMTKLVPICDALTIK